jgi:serine/threonine protein kinase
MLEFRATQSIYKIERAIGDGMSAQVFKALRTDSSGIHHQIVALKVLKDRNELSRLGLEFEALTKVQSPHCVRVLAWENLRQGPALVLEWIDGITLFELAKLNALDSLLLMEIETQIVLGLNALRSSGLFHGDLHPNNVLIDINGCVKLVDFGVYTPNRLEIRGVPSYLAPEIWKGEKASFESDLFSLKLILRDIRTSFLDVPLTVQDAKTRAEILSSEIEKEIQKTICAESDRGLESRPASVLELAAAVHLARRKKEEKISRTEILKSPFLRQKSVPEFVQSLNWTFLFRSSSRIAASAFVLFAISVFGIGAPVRADAPVDRNIANRSTMEIRSLHWMTISINGKKAGYAPVSLQGLLPGHHRISWKTENDSGERLVALSPGGKLLLSEGDLKKPN